RPHTPHTTTPANAYSRVSPSLVSRPARIRWTAMNVASSTNGAWARFSDTSHSPTAFHRTAPEPRPLLRPPEPWPLVVWRFQTCRPVYLGFSKIIPTVRTIHRTPDRCELGAGSALDGHGTPRSFNSRTNDATDRPRARSANIHRTQ